jgi:two-component system, NtrC family, response regulator
LLGRWGRAREQLPLFSWIFLGNNWTWSHCFTTLGPFKAKSMSKKILIIDDEEKLRSLMARIIGLEGFEVLEAGDGKTAMQLLAKNSIQLVLCDVKLPDCNGIELAQQIKASYPHLEIILLTAYGNIPDSVKAIKNGAFEYLTKGDDNKRIIPLVHLALEKSELVQRVEHLEKSLDLRRSFEQIIGNSNTNQQAVDLAKKVAKSTATVLLNGETGTGKEVFAQAIHQGSDRHKKNFVAVNCAAISKDLLESELFGHIAGAFTGASKDKKGLFEEANHGTIFLDEIGEMAIELQAKLLRVLETGTFFRVGESKPTHVDLRVIAATNRSLMEEIQAGRFRDDLYYRISVFTIKLTPLRERTEDIEALAQHFLAYYAQKTKRNINGFDTDYLQALKNYAWPGNIRELKNIIERSVILNEGPLLQSETLPFEWQGKNENPQKDQVATNFDLAFAEKQHIIKVLKHTKGNKTETARLLGVALTTLYRKISEYQIE